MKTNLTNTVNSKDLSGRPDLYLLELSSDQALFVHMSRESYAKSIFTDRSRICTSEPGIIQVDLDEVMKQFDDETSCPPKGYIFHMAYCGSTLLSRALDMPGRCLAIREPMPLRQLAVERSSIQNNHMAEKLWGKKLCFATGMLGRTYCENEKVVIKANVPVNFILDPLLSASKGATCIFLYPDIKTFLIQALKAPPRRKWIANIYNQIGSRLKSIDTQAVIEWKSLSIGKAAAYLWFCQFHQMNIAVNSRGNMYTLQSEYFFREPNKALRMASEAYELDIDSEELKNITNSSLFKHYSKDPSIAYSNKDRELEADYLYRKHITEIEEASTWVKHLVDSYSLPEQLPNSLIR